MIKRFLSVILVFTFLLAALPAGGLDVFAFFGVSLGENGNISRYIVTFREDADAKKLLADYEYRALSEQNKVYLVTANDISVLSSYCVSVEKDLTRELLTLPYTDTCEANGFCGIPASRTLANGGKNITVAVLDTGVDREHTCFENTTILEGYDATTDTVGVNGDVDGHGTAVISIIAASGGSLTGVAPNVSIYPVKVSEGGGAVYSSHLVAGIYNAADNGADIINISLGGYSYSVSEQQAVNYAVSKGCIIIAAAGNDGADASLAGKYFYPASYDGVISVASVDPDGAPSRFSQYNDKVDIAAPGRDVSVGIAGSGNDYGIESGTSFSAAIVSGVAALAASAADGLDSTQFLYLLISLSSGVASPYTGYGIIDAEKVVSAALDPIVTGVYNGAVLTSPPVITFNKGEAKLDGVPFASGGTVTVSGRHTLAVTYEKKTVRIYFTLSDEKLEYSVGEDYISFSSGQGYIDGMPYISGTQIQNGIHSFVLKGKYSSVSAKVNIGAGGYISGVEQGAEYSSAVMICGYGDGVFSVNGVPFTGNKVLSDGEYTATVTDTDGVLVSSVTFTVNTAKKSHSGFANGNIIYSDKANGYVIVTDGSANMRVYDSDDLSVPVRTLRAADTVVGFERDEENLYVITESGTFSSPRKQLNGTDAPVFAPVEGFIPNGGYSFDRNKLYFEDNCILSTPYGRIISVDGDTVYTSWGILDLAEGGLIAVFCDEAVSVSENYVLFRNLGLVEFSDINDISASPVLSAVGQTALYNRYTSSAYMGISPKQTAFDFYSGKIFMLSEGTVHFTDTSFVTSDTLALRYVPLYITAGYGKLFVFFEDGYCEIDSYTLEKTYYLGISCPDKAVAGENGIAAVYGNTLAVIQDGVITFSGEMAVSDIAVHGDVIFVANSEGIGIFGFDGAYRGSISAGDTKELYTDGVYLASRDTVYLVSDGSAVSRNSYKINGIMNGMLFTERGVYSPQGEKLSDFVYNGLFADGYCITTDGGFLTVHGGADTGASPEIQGGDGVHDLYAEISTDTGVLFVDGELFEGGRYVFGGNHLLECATPFGVIYSSNFSVIPALNGISVSGGDREMNLGDRQYILVEYLPYGASAVPATFSVTGESVTIDENGLITAVSEGVSVVTVTAGGYTASASITVTQLEISFSDVNFYFDPDTRVFAIPAATTPAVFAEVILSDGEYYRITREDGTEVMNDEFISTGTVFSFVSDTGTVIATVTAVVRGDTDKDGVLSASDIRTLERGIIGDDIGVYSAYAGDMEGNGELTAEDKALLIELISQFTFSLPSEENGYVVTSSVPATVHPAGEFAVTMYVDGGIGIDSVCGTLVYDTEIFQLLYVAGVNYELCYNDNDGLINFSAYDKDGAPSDRVIKTFGVAMFRVKEDAALQNAEFLLTNCAVTAVGSLYTSQPVAKGTDIARRNATDFSIKINNAEFFVFNPSIRSYYVELPYNAVTVDIEVDYPDGGIVYCSDTLIPESDELTVDIRYTSPLGVSTNYKIHVTRAAAELLSNDPLLESIISSSGILLPEFVPERLTYKLNISFDSPDPVFSYVRRNENTAVTVEMPSSFPVGSTDVVFNCVAQDGTTAKYIVTVIRAAAPVVSEPAESSESDTHSGGGNWIVILVTAVAAAAATAVIFYVINRKEKNNVKEIK